MLEHVKLVSGRIKSLFMLVHKYVLRFRPKVQRSFRNVHLHACMLSVINQLKDDEVNESASIHAVDYLVTMPPFNYALRCSAPARWPCGVSLAEGLAPMPCDLGVWDSKTACLPAYIR